MSEPIPFLRHRSDAPRLELDRIISAALMREAEERFARGDRLVDGHWQEKATVPQARLLRRRTMRRNLIEGLMLWSGVGVLGLAFVGLTLLLV